LFSTLLSSTIEGESAFRKICNLCPQSFSPVSGDPNCRHIRQAFDRGFTFLWSKQSSVVESASEVVADFATTLTAYLVLNGLPLAGTTM